MTTQSSTFWNRDGEDVEHFHGNHWHSFVEDTAQFMVKALPAAIQQARVIGRKPDVVNAENGPHGIYLGHAVGDAELIALIEVAEDGNHLCAAWPEVGNTGLHRLVLREGFLWSNGLEAQLGADFGPSRITFFDARYLEHGGKYHADMAANFRLAAIAYFVEKPDDKPAYITKPEMIHAIEPDRDPHDDSPIEIHMTGMAAFFQHGKNDRDDCEFRGPIKAVHELPSGAFGARAWVLKVTVLRDSDADDEDINLDIVVSERALRGQVLPNVGDDIQGAGWVQGWLDA
jgi:hypothetical protein